MIGEQYLTFEVKVRIFIKEIKFISLLNLMNKIDFFIASIFRQNLILN
jgi:hypothetical protein